MKQNPLTTPRKVNRHFPLALIFVIVIPACAIRKVETSKNLYEHAMQAEEAGQELEAIVSWKALVQQTNREISQSHYVATNYFLRATAHMELGEWDQGFADLKQIQPETLRKEEYWIYPLCLVLLGDYYSENNMPSVAQDFYQSVLKKSAYKTTSVYILALERQVNNSVKAIQLRAQKEGDPDKFRRKEYESLASNVEKYIEETPFTSVPHFLLADLLAKMDRTDEALEHLIASIELGLPTHDLQQSAEFEMATLLTQQQVGASLRSLLLRKAKVWWGGEDVSSIFKAGEDTVEALQTKFELPAGSLLPAKDVKIKYLAIAGSGRPRIVVWEK